MPCLPTILAKMDLNLSSFLIALRAGKCIAQGAAQPHPAGPQLPAVGKTFTGLVLKRDEAAVVIEVPGFRRERAVAVLTIEPSTPQWKPGERARVEVTGVRQRGDLTILDVKRGAKAEKK